MKRIFQKTFSVILCVCMFLCVFSAGFVSFAIHNDIEGKYDFTIENPYQAVDWDEWGQYKASLHSHTNVSDGVPTVAESVEEHYRLGYDILAISDHAVIGSGWTDDTPNTVPLYRLVKFGNAGQKNLEALSDERYEAITNGTDRGGRGMLEVTRAAELNGATPINDCHVNGFFSDWGQSLMGIYGDYETVVKNVEKAGGITFLDHTGEYVGCENDPDRAREPYYSNKFANIFLKYKSCTAIDVNSGKNNRTKYDYILWDEILKKTIPNGRNVFCVAFSDGHHLDQYDRAFTMMCMSENTLDNLRNCMETGAYFSIGRYALADLGDDFVGTGDPPKITELSVNQETDTISFIGTGFDNVKWISDGKVIAEGSDITSLDLNKFEDTLGCYVRFTVTGAGGILYSQAFPIKADGFEIAVPQVVPTVDVPRVLRCFSNCMSAVFGLLPTTVLIRWLLWGRVWWIY